MVYKFNVYWNDKEKVSFLQRVILIHSYLYYVLSDPVWSDRKYDEISKQLCSIQNKHNQEWIKTKTQYGYVFYDFDGTTGFDLFYRLNRNDQRFISTIAERIANGKI